MSVSAACSGGGETETQSEAAPEGGFSKPLGAQLYTLRDILPDDPAKILNDLAAIGYAEAEVLQRGFDNLGPLVREAGLEAASMHLQAQVITGVWGDAEPPPQKTPEEAIEWAAAHGVNYVVMPYLPKEQRGTDVDHYKKLAEKLNAAGQLAKEAGLGFAYHNHAFEFEPMGDTTPLDALMDGTDSVLVELELDVFWVAVAGLDPVELLKKYAGRVPLVHLKDMAADTPQMFAESVPRTSFKEVGAGSMDFPAILTACEAAGVKHYFVEQDQTDDPLASLTQSYNNLRGMEV